MKNTRTFTDLDLNFLPAPSSQDRYAGIGTIAFTNLNTIVTGTNTIFLTFLDINNNLYVNNVFLGKIKSIISDTSIELYEVVPLPSEIDIEYTYSLPADISVKTDANAIKAAVKHLVLTSNYERHFHSDIGSQVRAIMFEPATPMTQILLQRSIVDVINSYEPRVQLIEVIVSLDNPSYSANVTIYFQIINTTQPLRIDLVLERAR
jgi:phage baseplate assembly protein W